jgi:hypothetical protein
MAREEQEHEVLQAELRQEAEVLVIDVKKAELLAQKILRQHSVRLKVALSELLVAMADKMRSGSEVRLREMAAAVVALKSVGTQLYGWDREPDVREMERAKDYAINIPLQCTPPEKLKALALAKRGLLTPEHECQGVGPSPIRQEQPGAGGDGPGDRKGDPKEPAKEKQPYPECGENHGIDHGEKDSARSPEGLNPGIAHQEGNPLSVGSPPLSPQERRRQELKELARLRAEWRGRPFNSST